MVRIIHVVGGMNRGGAETLIMSIFRNIDRDHFQFDFAVETNQPCHYDDEIICMDGQIIPHPHPKKGLRDYGRALKKTLQNYGPYDVIHSHVYQLSGYVLSIANKSSVPIRIAHSHNTQDSRPNSVPRNIYRCLGKTVGKTNVLKSFRMRSTYPHMKHYQKIATFCGKILNCLWMCR